MTAARALQLNGDMTGNSPMMEAVRRFHDLCNSRGLSYCVVGGMAVIRNGYARTTTDIDILTYKDEWMKVIPIQGEISSDGIDNCTDSKTGVRIDILFADEDWEMPMGMPDPRSVGEFDEILGANFIGLHALVQLKAAVYLGKLRENGPEVAAKDLADVFELMRRNIDKFSKEVFQTYHPDVRKQCKKTFDAAVRAEKGQGRKHRDNKP